MENYKILNQQEIEIFEKQQPIILDLANELTKDSINVNVETRSGEKNFSCVNTKPRELISNSGEDIVFRSIAQADRGASFVDGRISSIIKREIFKPVLESGIINGIQLAPKTVGLARENAAVASPKGYQFEIDTLTYISSEIISEEYHSGSPVASLFKEKREGGWAENYVYHTLRSDFSSNIEDYEISSGNNQKIPNVQAETSHLTFTIGTYAISRVSNLMAMAQAGQANIDITSEHIRLLAKQLISSLNKALVLGTKGLNKIQGLLNYDISSDAVIFANGGFDVMTAAELNVALSQMFGKWIQNAKYSDGMLPDFLMVRTKDATSFGSFVEPTFAIKQRGTALREAINVALQGLGATEQQIANFKIVSSPYLDKDVNGLTQSYYFLGNSNQIEHLMPVPITQLAEMTYNGFNFNQIMYVRSGGLALKRAQSLFKFLVG